jgi:mRNA interferase RelE/StbE
MAYNVTFSSRARRELGNLPRAAQVRIKPRFDALANEPRPPGVKKLSGESELYRIRVGDYRVLYAIEDDELVVLVVSVADRKEAYRRGLP